jgi:hypothetical protein
MGNNNKLMLALNSPDRFKIIDDGWVKDEVTGLDFGPSSEKTMNLADAIKYCEEKGGRLPEIHELHSLVDFTKNEPAINAGIFKDTKHDDWYWSGTKTAWRKDAAWCVSFCSGNVYFCYESNVFYVRPVRSSQLLK